MVFRIQWLAAACMLGLFSPSLRGGETLRVGGTGVALGGLQVLARAYEKQHPGASIRVLPSIGSTGGIRAAIDGKLDVACTGRPLRPEERVSGLVATPWVTTPFVFATHEASAREDLSLAGVEDIFAGRRTTWKDGRPIRLILRPKSDSSFAFLAGLSPGMAAALDQARARPGITVGITDQEALAEIEKTPGSFGTTVLGLVLSESRRVQVLPVNGSRPTEAGYPFRLTLILLHREDSASALARHFLAFVQSREALRLLRRSGYQPLPATAGQGR